MQIQLLHWLLLLLLVATVGLIVAASVYFVLRFFEKWLRDRMLLFNIAFVLPVLLELYIQPLFLYVVMPAVVAALCGFKFHQKSGGASKTSWHAFLFMTTAIQTTVRIELALLPTVLRLPGLRGVLFPLSSSTYVYFYCFLLLAAVPPTPFLLWAYQNSHLRPGIDRHLEASEEPS